MAPAKYRSLQDEVLKFIKCKRRLSFALCLLVLHILVNAVNDTVNDTHVNDTHDTCDTSITTHTREHYHSHSRVYYSQARRCIKSVP